MIASEDEMIAFDRNLWQAAMERRLDDFRAMMASDYVGLYARGFVTADDDVSATGTMAIRSFRFEDVRARALSDDLFLTTYVTALDAKTGDGRDISGRYASTSIWKITDTSGKDGLIYHAESRLP